MKDHPYDDPDPVPIYILFIFAVLLCAYFAWLGSVAVRFYIYKGALAPEPERFVILPAYLRDRKFQRGHQTRVTAFPIPVPPKSPARELACLSRVPRVSIAEDVEQLPDPEVRVFLAEQQRISRLPALVQVSTHNTLRSPATHNRSGRLRRRLRLPRCPPRNHPRREEAADPSATRSEPQTISQVQVRRPEEGWSQGVAHHR